MELFDVPSPCAEADEKIKDIVETLEKSMRARL